MAHAAQVEGEKGEHRHLRSERLGAGDADFRPGM